MAHGLVQALAFLAFDQSAQQNHSQHGLGRDIGSNRTLIFHISCPVFIISVAKQRFIVGTSVFCDQALSLSPAHKELLKGSRITPASVIEGKTTTRSSTNLTLLPNQKSCAVPHVHSTCSLVGVCTELVLGGGENVFVARDAHSRRKQNEARSERSQNKNQARGSRSNCTARAAVHTCFAHKIFLSPMTIIPQLRLQQRSQWTILTTIMTMMIEEGHHHRPQCHLGYPSLWKETTCSDPS